MTVRIKALSAAALLLCMGLAVSCSNERTEPGPQEQPQAQQGFSGGTTRVDALTGDPQHGDAYTLVSYTTGGTTLAQNQITNTQQYGYYAYDDGSSYGTPGALIPVAIRFPATGNTTPPALTPPFYVPSAGTSPLVMDWTQAQQLNSIPAGGAANPTSQGIYRTAVIYPAIPMRNTGTNGLGYLAVFERTDDVWASSPDNADGMGTPFQFTVTSNGQVNPLPNPTELYPIKAAVKVWLYSEYYDEILDPTHTTVKSQTFTIGKLWLYNTGSNGWFNARTGIVYPNYNYTPASPTNPNSPANNYRLSYSPTLILPAGTNNYVDMGTGTADNVTMAPDQPGLPAATQTIQWTAEQTVFPSDYRGSATGGLAQVMPMTLMLALNMGGGGVNKASVPISLVIERGKRYNFYINVKSELIEIIYNVSAWDEVPTTGDIGGPMMNYATIPLTYTPGPWDNGGGGSNDIGN